MWLAGGGVKAGVTHGQTDAFGLGVVKDAVHVNDLHATLLHLLGFDHLKLTYRFQGRDFRLTDVAGNIVKELLAQSTPALVLQRRGDCPSTRSPFRVQDQSHPDLHHYTEVCSWMGNNSWL